MARIERHRAERGSQKWLQVLINQRPELINDELRGRIRLKGGERIEWRSPLESDKYSEYSDGAYLDRLDITLKKKPLDAFWPNRGLVWDALGRTDRGDLLLVEAKAHIGEMVSFGTGAEESSLDLIQKSLSETKSFIESTSEADWTSTFYRYTNRLAHLYFFRKLNELPAYLIFLYFINAEDMNGPRTQEKWEKEIKDLKAILGLGNHKLSPYVLDVFVDVEKLRK
jgi:hypothetical protein